MFENFKKNLKRSRLAKKSVLVERELSFRNFQTARTCLLFGIEGDASPASIEKLRSALPAAMSVEVLILEKEKDRPAGDKIKQAIRVSEGDISLSGKLVNARLREIIHFSHDLLIDLSSSPDSIGDYLLKSSRAKCKIGMEREGFQGDIIFEGIKEIESLQARLNDLLGKVKTR